MRSKCSKFLTHNNYMNLEASIQVCGLQAFHVQAESTCKRYMAMQKNHVKLQADVKYDLWLRLQ